MALIDFDTWLAGHAKSDIPHLALAATFHFASQTMHVWTGVGPVVAPDRTFQGVGNVGSIKGLELGYGRPTDSLQIELSGLDSTFFALAAGQETEVRGQRMEIWLLGFGTGNAGEEWVLAAASQEGIREMEKMTRSIDYEAGVSKIVLAAEPVAAMRWRAPFGLLTHEDQIARHSGDRGLERVSLVQYSRPLNF